MSCVTLAEALAALDGANRPGSGVTVVTRYHDETNEEAIARWLLEHPSHGMNGAGLRITVTRWREAEPDTLRGLLK